MNKRGIVNGVFGAFSVVLIVAFLSQLRTGAFFGIRPTTLPLIVTCVTFMVLAAFQVYIAWVYEKNPLHRPVPFRWVMAAWFSSLVIVVVWALAIRFNPSLATHTT
jgi:hypothetical protein